MCRVGDKASKIFIFVVGRDPRYILHRRLHSLEPFVLVVFD